MMTRYHQELFRHLTDLLVALGPAGILLLSILDSSVPVAGILDGLLILDAAQKPEIAWLCASLAVIGSTVGTMLLFLAARKGGRRYMENAAPEGRAARYRNWFRRYGLITVFIPALLPIPMPLKLFVISAGVMGTPLIQMFSVVLAARICRYFAEAWLGLTLGRESGGFMKAHALHFMAGAATLFVVLYAIVRLRDTRRSASV